MNDLSSDNAPHRRSGRVVTSRRGSFWIPGEIVDGASGTVQVGQMFVRWEAPPVVRFPYPLILIHGGGGQGTEWDLTVTGDPGWASLLVEEGFVVYVVDRVGYGRSRSDAALLGQTGPPATYEAAKRVFCPVDDAGTQTQWPYGREPGCAELDQLVAGMGSVLSDLAQSQALDCKRLSTLLDMVGPCCLVSHSAGSAVGWLAADARPNLVQGIVAIEPVGPPFSSVPGIGKLTWGLTAVPMKCVPPVDSVEDLVSRAPADRRIPSLEKRPIGLVRGMCSPISQWTDEVAAFLEASGAIVTVIDLASIGIVGNGHGIMVEANAEATVRPVVAWLRATVDGALDGRGES